MDLPQNRYLVFWHNAGQVLCGITWTTLTERGAWIKILHTVFHITYLYVMYVCAGTIPNVHSCNSDIIQLIVCLRTVRTKCMILTVFCSTCKPTCSEVNISRFSMHNHVNTMNELQTCLSKLASHSRWFKIRPGLEQHYLSQLDQHVHTQYI